MTPEVQAKALVIIPTYNESQSLAGVVERIRRAVPDAEILVVDDASPDGTGELADRLANEDSRVHVLHRAKKAGLGLAYVAGFDWGLAQDFDTLVEFDADGSHQPEQLPQLLAPLDLGAAMAIGTRWMPGGSVRNWPWFRRAISRTGTWFARVSLRSELRDITSGMRAFRASTLKMIHYETASAHGYGFQVELAWRAERAGLAIAQVPIDFVERAEGKSKMSIGIVLEALWLVTKWGWQTRFKRQSG